MNDLIKRVSKKRVLLPSGSLRADWLLAKYIYAARRFVASKSRRKASRWLKRFNRLHDQSYELVRLLQERAETVKLLESEFERVFLHDDLLVVMEARIKAAERASRLKPATPFERTQAIKRSSQRIREKLSLRVRFMDVDEIDHWDNVNPFSVCDGKWGGMGPTSWIQHRTPYDTLVYEINHDHDGWLRRWSKQANQWQTEFDRSAPDVPDVAKYFKPRKDWPPVGDFTSAVIPTFVKDVSALQQLSAQDICGVQPMSGPLPGED